MGRSRLQKDSLLVQGSRRKEEEDQECEWLGRAARPALSQGGWDADPGRNELSSH